MLVADTYLGDRDDPTVAKQCLDADVHRVVLSDVERRRSRVRTETVDGREIGIVVARNLGDGDVLATEDDELVIVELADVEAVVLDLEAAGLSPETALELGHAIGNRHWDLAVSDGTASFPAPDSREQVAETVDGILPDDVGIDYEFVPPTTFETARSAEAGHSHAHSHGDEGRGGDPTHTHGNAGAHRHDGDDDP